MRDVIERMKDFDYKISSKKQAPKNIRVSYSNVIEIVFNYPLANPVTLVFSNPNGWTLQSFVNAVREGYKLIYKNRLKFGVWGHSKLVVGALPIVDSVGAFRCGYGYNTRLYGRKCL